MRFVFLEVVAALVLLIMCFMFVGLLKAIICSITPSVCSLPDVQQCFILIYLILITLGIGIAAYGITAFLIEWSTRCNP